MLITFLTVLSWLYTTYYLFSILGLFYKFSQLTQRDQSVTKIQLHWKTLALFLISVAFLITKALM